MQFIIRFSAVLLWSALSIQCNKAAKNAMTNKSDTPTPTLEGTYWKLYELNQKPVSTVAGAGKEPHLILQSTDSTIKGNGGCNGYGGKYELKAGGRIRFSRIISTMMACENLATENEFFKTLEMADNYYLKGDTLILNKAKMATLARFKAVYLK